MSNLFIQTNVLWDIAGVDGLQVMKALFGEACDRIAPFQSFEVELEQIPCSVLRLCEGNFRLRWAGDIPHLRSILHSVTATQRVWVKQFPWLRSLQLSDHMTISQLSCSAISPTGELLCIAKPPFSLQSLAINCAAPARIDGISVLVWRHTMQGAEHIELHTAWQSIQQLEQSLAKAT